MCSLLLFLLLLLECSAHIWHHQTPHTRDYFYLGGRYVNDGRGDFLFSEQTYVEHLVPAHGIKKPYPLVLIHGQAQTGTNWLNTPDNRPGWSSYFLHRGYEIYIIDQPFRGRSPFTLGSTNYSAFNTTYISSHFTAPEVYNIWPQASLHTQWPSSSPLKGQRGDPIFDAFFATQFPYQNDTAYQQRLVRDAGASLLDRIGRPAILLGHSQGGPMPWLIADARPNLTHAMVLLEPQGPPFHEAVFTATPARAWGLIDIPLTYDPPVSDPLVDLVTVTTPAANSSVAACTLQKASDPPPRQLVNLKGIPIVVVTAEASYHTLYDWCTVAFAQQAGLNVEHLKLGEVGIRGNGHMMFIEKNSDDVANVVEGWIDEL